MAEFIEKVVYCQGCGTAVPVNPLPRLAEMGDEAGGMRQGTRLGPGPDIPGDSGFDAVGKPVPAHRKHNAVAHCKDMGLTDMLRITALIGQVANKIERDEPYEAMRIGMRYLDLTGTYRLLAVLCTGDAPTHCAATEEASALAFEISDAVGKQMDAYRERAEKAEHNAEGARQKAIRLQKRYRASLVNARRLMAKRVAEIEAGIEEEVERRIQERVYGGPVDSTGTMEKRAIEVGD